jgi:hypothetical protein
MRNPMPEVQLESSDEGSTLFCFRNLIVGWQEFGNGIKHSVVIPEVRDIKNTHLELFSDKLVHISYGPLALRF